MYKYKCLIIIFFVIYIQACGFKGGNVNLPKNTGNSINAHSAAANSQESFLNNLQSKMGLSTTSAAQPSSFLNDAAYRTKIQARLVQEANLATCNNIEIVSTFATDEFLIFLLGFQLAQSPNMFYLTLSVPQRKNSFSLMLLNDAGFVSKTSETNLIKDMFNNNIIVQVPKDSFVFAGKTYAAPKLRRAFLDDAIVGYGAINCLQKHAEDLKLDNFGYLGSVVKGKVDGILGFETAIAGFGSGGLVSLLELALSGSLMLSNAAASEAMVRFDNAILINSLFSLYGAEARLWLATLVSGYSDESKYNQIYGVPQIRSELFKPLRENTITTEEVAFELLLRDAFVTAPFANVALKNYAKPLTEKGLAAGNLLILHENNRLDFSINQARIYANIATSVQLYATELSNGANILYRELSSLPFGKNNSYINATSDGFLQNPTNPIQDFYISITEALKNKTDTYNCIIIGCNFGTKNAEQASNVLSGFLTR